jgi:hypothetical protein
MDKVSFGSIFFRWRHTWKQTLILRSLFVFRPQV